MNQPQYNPSAGQTITVDRFLVQEEGTFDSPEWRKEEWLIRSALIPIDQLASSVVEIKSPDYFNFDPGWNFDDKFDFGTCSHFGDIKCYSITSILRHPVSKHLIVKPSQDFRLYHALEERENNRYYHPLDNIIVAETFVEKYDLYDPAARVTIHRDYLRDFLAEKQMGLVISIVADRFANASTEDALEIPAVEEYEIGELACISTNVHTPDFTHHSFFRGRSILHRNIVIEPYDKPRYDRSPWHYFGSSSSDKAERPSFIINDEGKRERLPENTFLQNYIEKGIGIYGYLWFRPEVLQRYLQVPGYHVSFHMRNWGIASLPGDRGTVDVGINSQGLVNAFAPDIANLPSPEQSYWASFSSLPSGELCDELFQTRMQQQPPHSPGVIELVREARKKIAMVLNVKHSIELFRKTEPSTKELSMLSVGPILNQFSEVAQLAKILYGWIIETMRLKPLRSVWESLGGTVNEKYRQIKILEECLIAKGIDEQQARLITAPLRGLNGLRQGAAHIGSLELDNSFQLMGASSTPQSPRDGWTICIDSVCQALASVAIKLDES